jgi:hypothetical protein
MTEFDVHQNAAEMFDLFAARQKRIAEEREARGDAEGAERSRALAERQAADAERERSIAEAA